MSNFAQRLVARGAGQPLGTSLAVLTPRPVTRFEPMPIMEIEVQTAAETPLPDARSAAGAPVNPTVAREDARPAHASLTPAPASLASSARFEQTVMTPAGDMPPLQQQTTLALPGESGQQPPPPAAVHEERVVQAERSEPPVTIIHAAEPATPLLQPLPLAEANMPLLERPQFTLVERGADAAAVEARTAAGHDGPEQQPPAPVISIGKIEVQFLPQEQRMQPPRPQPQRTSGFDAYARARRGEPR